MKTNHVLLAIALVVLAGCAGVSLGTPRIWQERVVAVVSSSKKLIISEPLSRSAHEGADRYDFHLPKGEYRLEAEDSDYLYYEGVEKIVLVVQKGYGQPEGRPQKGGIFIAKNRSASVNPGGAYVDWDDGKKLLLVTLDSDFFGVEGRFWHYEQ
jgi:hypothetical protein